MYKNIFLPLSKYCNSDENYLTEAFVFVLNSLLEKNKAVCLKILSSLCIKNDDYQFSPNEDIVISTQEITPQGTPDIKISSVDKLIYIEVKHRSGLGESQIERYKTALKLNKDKKHKYVILLTRFSVDFDNEEARPYKHVRWFEIHNWFSNIIHDITDPIALYLSKSFLNFLEEKKMIMQKVGSEYINGVTALVSFINMLEEAIKSESLTIYQKSAGWEWMGFYIQSNQHYCGIYYENPALLKFETYKNNKTLESDSISLNLESVDFFSLDKNKQFDTLITFIRKFKEILKKQ